MSMIHFHAESWDGRMLGCFGHYATFREISRMRNMLLTLIVITLAASAYGQSLVRRKVGQCDDHDFRWRP